MGREGVTVLADRRPRRADLVPEAALEVILADRRRQAVGFRCLRLVEFCLHACRIHLVCLGLTASVKFTQYRCEAERRLAELVEPVAETDLAIWWFERVAAAVPPQSKMVVE